MNSDKTAQTFDLHLVDASGTGYHLHHRRGSTEMVAHFFRDGLLVWGDEFEADTRAIEFMLTTPCSVARAIADDRADGHVRSAFNDGYASVSERLDMDFDLAHPEGNTHVRCSLNLVDEDDPNYYELGVSFIVTSDDLLRETAHMDVLLD